MTIQEINIGSAPNDGNGDDPRTTGQKINSNFQSLLSRAQPRNLMINGDFSVWQRGTSQTSSGYGSDDRWRNTSAGSTKVASRQTHTLGSSSPTGNPKYYARTNVTSVAGAGNLVIKEHQIDGVLKTSGETVTLSFWAKADAGKDIAIEFVQDFGSGGSPSAIVTGIGVTTFTLTTGWAKYTATVFIPGVSGKILGANGDDFTEVIFWFDAGSNFDSRTNTLGQQSGTFDISSVQLEIGDVATDFEFTHPADQLARCQRYFERIDIASGGGIATSHNTGATTSIGTLQYIRKRSVPTVGINTTGSTHVTLGGGSTAITITPITTSENATTLHGSGAAGLTVDGAGVMFFTGGAGTIDIDAEL